MSVCSRPAQLPNQAWETPDHKTVKERGRKREKDRGGGGGIKGRKQATGDRVRKERGERERVRKGRESVR